MYCNRPNFRRKIFDVSNFSDHRQRRYVWNYRHHPAVCPRSGCDVFSHDPPQKKKDKQLQDLRNSLEIGDNVTTIGGIVGRVVAIKDESIVLETGTERNKVRFKRWAVQDVEKLVVE